MCIINMMGGGGEVRGFPPPPPPPPPPHIYLGAFRQFREPNTFLPYPMQK